MNGPTHVSHGLGAEQIWIAALILFLALFFARPIAFVVMFLWGLITSAF
jgi:hypothetical protein